MSSRSKSVTFVVVGAILFAPFFYNSEHAFDNALNFAFGLFGLSLIVIGILRFVKQKEIEEQTNHARHGAGENVDSKANAGSAGLATLFKTLGHLTVVLTIIGTALMFAIAETGGMSGVPIAGGLVVAGMFYGLSSLARG